MKGKDMLNICVSFPSYLNLYLSFLRVFCWVILIWEKYIRTYVYILDIFVLVYKLVFILVY